MTATGKMPVALTGAPQTTLATLYAKALDADAAHPILGDRYATQLVERIDYDWTRTSITARTAPSVTTRSAHFDGWARQFLAVHPRAVVLDAGCGLDTRYLRLQPGPGVQWYDVDYPDVAELRRRLHPVSANYHIVAASVTDPDWLAGIPADAPVLLIAEGLTMYLTESDGVGLLRRVVAHFGSGELHFDAFNRWGIRTQWANTVVRRSGARLHWAIAGPPDILAAVPGLRLLDFVSPFDADSFAAVPAGYRLLAAVMSRLPATRYMAQYHRYAFGPGDGGADPPR